MAKTAQVTKPKPWTEMATHLVDVAMGRKPADLVIRNGRWVNVHSGEIIAGTDIAIAGGRFAYCGPNASHAIGGWKTQPMAERYTHAASMQDAMDVLQRRLAGGEFRASCTREFAAPRKPLRAHSSMVRAEDS